MIKGWSRKKVSVHIFVLIFVLIPFIYGNLEKDEIRETYLEGGFGKIIENYSEPGLKNIDIKFQLIYLESLIREGELKRAEKLLNRMKTAKEMVTGLRALEGMLELAEGDLIRVEDIVANSPEAENRSFVFLQLKFFVELYKRNFIKAESFFNLNKRGFGLPSCAFGVTVPISTKPKPI